MNERFPSSTKAEDNQRRCSLWNDEKYLSSSYPSNPNQHWNPGHQSLLDQYDLLHFDMLSMSRIAINLSTASDFSSPQNRISRCVVKQCHKLSKTNYTPYVIFTAEGAHNLMNATLVNLKRLLQHRRHSCMYDPNLTPFWIEILDWLKRNSFSEVRYFSNMINTALKLSVPKYCGSATKNSYKTFSLLA